MPANQPNRARDLQSQEPETDRANPELVLSLKMILIGGVAFFLLSTLAPRDRVTSSLVAVGVAITIIVIQKGFEPVLDRVVAWLRQFWPGLAKSVRTRLILGFLLIAPFIFILSLPTPPFADVNSTSQLSLEDTPLPFQTSAAEGWGDSEGGRPAINYRGEDTRGTATPVFNSIVGRGLSGMPSRDERNFLLVDRFELNWVDVLDVEPGDVVRMLAYVHNNAEAHTNGTNYEGDGPARNTRLLVRIPDEASTRVVLRAWIISDNATPRWITDSVALRSSVPIHVEPVNLSAERWLQGSGLRSPVGSELFTRDGALLGIDDVETPGLFPGCWEYRNFVYVTLRVTEG